MAVHQNVINDPSSIVLEPYHAQLGRWPRSGHHILAQFDDETILVYQAFKPSIGLSAASSNRFGTGFSLDRMTWLKTNFLWMMYRSGWGTKRDQEVTLAIRLSRAFFNELLATGVRSSFDKAAADSHEDWKSSLKNSDVVFQWDPDHDPFGGRIGRRAIQIGIRGYRLQRYAADVGVIDSITDISRIVDQQRRNLQADLRELLTPTERVYAVPDERVARRIGLDAWTNS